jgi:chlorite dismutase
VSESTPRSLSHFAVFAFKDAYWSLSGEERGALHDAWLGGLREAADKVDIYQAFPSEGGADVIVWCAVDAEDPAATARFFDRYARATNPHRAYLHMRNALWGFTRPSQYSRAGRSTQEIDPFAAERRTYLVIYPFVKNADWYLMGREARQGMMNEHIRIGKQYEEISQLLLYSFGVQDQEFVVVYEMDDIRRFSDLVAELRGTDGRRYTLRDSPLHAAIYRSPEETLALWR